MADYSTTSLLSSIKTRGMIPTSQLTFSDSDILSLASEELRLGIVPFMMKNRSDYFVTTTDTAIVSGTDTYGIPERAIGGKVKGISLVDGSGNVYPFPQIDKSERPQYNSQSVATFVYYFEGNNIVVVPSPTSNPGVSIRFSYYIRPSELITTTAAAQITSISSPSVTVSALPSSITTSTTIDFVKNKPGFECRAIDQSISSIVSNTLTFSSLPSGLAVGDWVCLSEQSPIPQIPVELHPMLAQRTAIKVLEALGDDKLQVAQAKLKEMEEAALHLLSSRSDSNPRKLVNYYSPLRR